MPSAVPSSSTKSFGRCSNRQGGRRAPSRVVANRSVSASGNVVPSRPRNAVVKRRLPDAVATLEGLQRMAMRGHLPPAARLRCNVADNRRTSKRVRPTRMPYIQRKRQKCRVEERPEPGGYMSRPLEYRPGTTAAAAAASYASAGTRYVHGGRRSERRERKHVIVLNLR